VDVAPVQYPGGIYIFMGVMPPHERACPLRRAYWPVLLVCSKCEDIKSVPGLPVMLINISIPVPARPPSPRVPVPAFPPSPRPVPTSTCRDDIALIRPGRRGIDRRDLGNAGCKGRIAGNTRHGGQIGSVNGVGHGLRVGRSLPAASDPLRHPRGIMVSPEFVCSGKKVV
jgi:hypothetical protein